MASDPSEAVTWARLVPLQLLLLKWWFLSCSPFILRTCHLSPMTVTYTARVANARFCGFSKLLLVWKGSIYKVLYKEFLAFFAMYSAISITYRWGSSFRKDWWLRNIRFWIYTFLFVSFHYFRFFLYDDQKRYFEKLAIYCNHYASLIPMSFVLGKLYCCSFQLWDNRRRDRIWATVCSQKVPELSVMFAPDFWTLDAYDEWAQEKLHGITL